MYAEPPGALLAGPGCEAFRHSAASSGAIPSPAPPTPRATTTPATPPKPPATTNAATTTTAATPSTPLPGFSSQGEGKWPITSSTQVKWTTASVHACAGVCRDVLGCVAFFRERASGACYMYAEPPGALLAGPGCEAFRHSAASSGVIPSTTKTAKVPTSTNALASSGMCSFASRDPLRGHSLANVLQGPAHSGTRVRDACILLPTPRPRPPTPLSAPMPWARQLETSLTGTGCVRAQPCVPRPRHAVEQQAPGCRCHTCQRGCSHHHPCPVPGARHTCRQRHRAGLREAAARRGRRGPWREASGCW